MNGPPKEKRGLETALKTAELLKAYRFPPFLQLLPPLVGWEREATRLFREFWRTGNRKHLRAFFVHVVAMRAYAERATQ
jgi:hypothetical protein